MDVTHLHSKMDVFLKCFSVMHSITIVTEALSGCAAIHIFGNSLHVGRHVAIPNLV